jgi:AMP deaminase
LAQIVGFDTVDDESLMEKVTSYDNYKVIKPDRWDAAENPPYSYWSYYIYANLLAINHLRRARGMNTFAYRPHCGEAGSRDHLACAFITAHSINHGIELQNDPVLQYLFYIMQIGMSMSPLSNNKLFLKFLENPFLKFF